MAKRHRDAGKARVARVNPAKRQHQQAEVVRLRSEGRSFREIAVALGKPYAAIPSGGWATLEIIGGGSKLPEGGHLFVFSLDK